MVRVESELERARGADAVRGAHGDSAGLALNTAAAASGLRHGDHLSGGRGIGSHVHSLLSDRAGRCGQRLAASADSDRHDALRWDEHRGCGCAVVDRVRTRRAIDGLGSAAAAAATSTAATAATAAGACCDRHDAASLDGDGAGQKPCGRGQSWLAADGDGDDALRGLDDLAGCQLSRARAALLRATRAA